MNKYVGEIEKNPQRVLSITDGVGASLPFDEAYALFDRRSEVQDAHDRCANMEICYLLQRLEALAGRAILTTNLKGAMDQASARRLGFVLDSPFRGRHDALGSHQATCAGVVLQD